MQGRAVNTLNCPSDRYQVGLCTLPISKRSIQAQSDYRTLLPCEWAGLRPRLWLKRSHPEQIL